jgi:hypothetical protein
VQLVSGPATALLCEKRKLAWLPSGTAEAHCLSKTNPFLQHRLLRYADRTRTRPPRRNKGRRAGMWAENSPNEGNGTHARPGA